MWFPYRVSQCGVSHESWVMTHDSWLMSPESFLLLSLSMCSPIESLNDSWLSLRDSIGEHIETHDSWLMTLSHDSWLLVQIAQGTDHTIREPHWETTLRDYKRVSQCGSLWIRESVNVVVWLRDSIRQYERLTIRENHIERPHWEPHWETLLLCCSVLQCVAHNKRTTLRDHIENHIERLSYCVVTHYLGVKVLTCISATLWATVSKRDSISLKFHLYIERLYQKEILSLRDFISAIHWETVSLQWEILYLLYLSRYCPHNKRTTLRDL